MSKHPKTRSKGTKFLEVRCCCKPETLYGWMEVPATAGRQPLAVQSWTGERVYLKFGEIDVGDGQGNHTAIKSDEKPLVYFKNLPGFVEKK